ncbi:unnamed protein product [Echinostoma caproni]|uniref:H15 domain-containing protein n=1 Tax=Echinostoma caproni TaxID=27848 RepID=A0A183BGB8_9TREM|nr:unnamed protein product [Echinostoma caproni]
MSAPAKKLKTVRPKALASHPPDLDMVKAAKNIHAVEKGVLVGVVNHGKVASKSFKLGEKSAAEHKPKAPKVKEAATPKKLKVAKKTR